MCLVGTTELELTVGIATGIDTYCAAGEEASPRDQPALVLTANASDLTMRHGNHSLHLAHEALVVEYDPAVGNADEAGASPLAIINGVKGLSRYHPVPYLLQLLLLVEYHFPS